MDIAIAVAASLFWLVVLFAGAIFAAWSAWKEK